MASPIIEIATGADTLVMYGDTTEGGWVYDNDALDSWLALADVDVDLERRPNAHGTYFPDQLFVQEHRTTIPGKYFGASALEAIQARNRLLALYNDGKRVMVTVTDDLGPTSRAGIVIDVDPEWMPDGHFVFTLTFVAPDPRRYGDIEESTTGLPTASSGLIWPLGTAASGLFWDWGTAGNSGRVSFTNDGNTTSYPVHEVGNGGDLPDGFAVTEVQTGRTITYPVATAGGVVRIDHRTQRVTINGGDVTGNLTRKEWFAVPPQTTYEYQLVTLGASTGAPELRSLAADAYL